MDTSESVCKKSPSSSSFGARDFPLYLNDHDQVQLKYHVGRAPAILHVLARLAFSVEFVDMFSNNRGHGLEAEQAGSSRFTSSEVWRSM